MDKNEEFYGRIWTLVNNNDPDNPEYSFQFNGVTISNPFMDETGRFDVDPVKYYGTHFLSSNFVHQVHTNEAIRCIVDKLDREEKQLVWQVADEDPYFTEMLIEAIADSLKGEEQNG